MCSVNLSLDQSLYEKQFYSLCVVCSVIGISCFHLLYSVTLREHGYKFSFWYVSFLKGHDQKVNIIYVETFFRWLEVGILSAKNVKEMCAIVSC